MFSFIRIGVVLVFLHINTNPKIPLEPQSHSKLLSLLWCFYHRSRNVAFIEIITKVMVLWGQT